MVTHIDWGVDHKPELFERQILINNYSTTWVVEGKCFKIIKNISHVNWDKRLIVSQRVQQNKTRFHYLQIIMFTD